MQGCGCRIPGAGYSFLVHGAGCRVQDSIVDGLELRVRSTPISRSGTAFTPSDWFGMPHTLRRSTTREEDAEGTPTQSHISPNLLVYEERRWFRVEDLSSGASP